MTYDYHRPRHAASVRYHCARRAGSRRRAYSENVWESLARSVVGPMIAATGAVLAPAPSSAVDVVPVLTTTPFGALPGQQVTHTVTVSGQGTVTDARVTFTTTVDLDTVTAHTARGRCAVSARSVVCDLGDLRLDPGSSAPRVTITGRVRPNAPPGSLVRNRVVVSSAPPGAAGTTSNAYLLAGATATPTDQPQQESHPAATDARPLSRWMAGPAVAAVVVAGAAMAGVLLARRLRRRRAQPPAQPPAVTAGHRDPI